MLKPIPMAKVAVVGPKDKLEGTIDALHELGLLHIEDYQPGEAGFELGAPLPEGSKVSEHLVRLRAITKTAQITPPPGAKPFTPENVRGLQAKLAEVEKELTHLIDQRTQVVDALGRVAEEAAILTRIQNFPVPLELVSGYRTLATVTGFLPAGTDAAPLTAVHKDADVTTSTEAEGVFVFAAAPKSAERALNEAASNLHLVVLELPPGPGTPAHRLNALETEKQTLDARAADIEAKIAAIRARHAASFAALDEYLSLRADRATAPVRFRTTRNAFMIEGWIPRADLVRLKNHLDTAGNHRVFVTELPSRVTQPWKHDAAHGHDAPHKEDAPEGHEAVHAEEESPPVQLEYGRARGGYQLLTDTYSRPKYGEIDPTIFFYFGFPFFYGFMLGDIGYGILLWLLVVFGAFNKVYAFFGFQTKGALNKIFRHCAYASIAFGLLYSEFFGLELFGHHGVVNNFEAHLGPIPYPLARFANVKLLLYLSLAVAGIHMLIGLVLGLRNAAADHGWVGAWKHRGSWLLILLGASIAAMVGLPSVLELHGFEIHNPTPLFVLAGISAIVGIILLLMGEGGIALLELPTVISNLLSYTRLVAIGLSGAGIALAGNEVAKLLLAGGTVSKIGAVLVLLFFHGLNLALGVLGPALHSLRLHYVEFFTKFYEGGGRPYAPFRAERRYTMKEVKQA